MFGGRRRKINMGPGLLLLGLLLSFLLSGVCRGEDTKTPGTCSKAVSTAEELAEIFPASYVPALSALLEEHPDWKFRAFYTGLRWEECFDGSYPVKENVNGQKVGASELYPSRNLIQYIENPAGTRGFLVETTYPTSWFSTKIYGAYNWAGNSWSVLSAPNWIQASEELIRYCMDPRNFLTEEQIFQFEDQTEYMGTVAEVERVFCNVSGSDFWVRAAGDTGILSDYTGEEKALTYAEAVYEIGIRIQMNPVILASRIVQEQGVGASPLISGNRTFTVTSGDDQGLVIDCENDPDLHYYNYFNMEATDGTGADYEKIYNNGLTEAYREGWDSRYKALLGGAKKLKERYVSQEQNTFYLQKFNVNSASKGCMWKQYMQSVLTPQYEAKKAYNSYYANGTVGLSHVFILPVFSEMPEEVSPLPEKDGNPNYKVGSVYINDTALEGFDPDRTEYSLEVENEVTSVRFNIHAYAASTELSVGSQTSAGDLSLEMNLMTGDNEFEIRSVAENGDEICYHLCISREGEVVYGDINGDKEFDSLDLAYMTAHLLGTNILTGNALEAADISGDSEVDSLDLAYLTSFLLGKITELPR